MQGVETVDIILPLESSEDQALWRKKCARKLGVPPRAIREMRLRKHSLDARKREIKVQLRLEVAVGCDLPPEPECQADYTTLPSGAKRVVIVGCGPAGMFAALRLIELGVKPVLLERGKDASSRRFDLAPILREGRV
ncbi:MAG: FAD-dependent monooxygenase, partial [Akkermansiaceae bacterium]